MKVVQVWRKFPTNCRIMKPLYLTFLAVCMPFLMFAQSEALYNIDVAIDPLEVRMLPLCDDPDPDEQQILRETSGWKNWAANHTNWRCIMSEATGLPHRAFGPAIDIPGFTIEDKASSFAENTLNDFGVDTQIIWEIESKMGQHVWAHAYQTWQGIPVKGGKLVTKWLNGQLIMWGADWYRGIPEEVSEVLSLMAQEEAATAGLTFDEWGDVEIGGLEWVPTRGQADDLVWHLCRTWTVSGRQSTIPRRYETGINVQTGEVIWRQNQVMHIDGKWGMPSMNGKPERAVLRMGIDNPISTPPLVISGAIISDVHEFYPYQGAVPLGLPSLELAFSGQTIYTDNDGGFITTVNGPETIDVELQGRWSTVFTDGITPEVPVDFLDGYNALNLSNLGNVKERSAYRSATLIHDHMKSLMPNFTGLDWSIPTNIDIEGECNAFYDGQSINFYDAGGGCNPTSLIADVVWHEYGHGINGYFYNSLNANFNNGAMNEGYADLWAMSLGDIAEIGKGFYTNSEDGIRVYDEDPKVYPEDLVGQVHADGEIICGAWYDTHLLMGGDWDATMALFIDAYPGLQATAPNGSEGQAYTDVLLDVLQADDDDGDLSNGTPNDLAIVEGFDIHGISIFSYAEIDHDSQEFVEAASSIEIEAETFIVFPYNLYFDAVYLWYRTESGGPWTQVTMNNPDGNALYTAEIPAQEPGTVVSYYMGISDEFGGLSAVTPFAAANDIHPNLPFNLLVGVEPVLINDSDEYSDFGGWTTGLPGQDNATTGIWEEAIPVGSYAELNDPNTMVAPTQDHTLGMAGYAFVTGQNPGVNDGIGANDVDAGRTTLVSPVIDLTPYENPIMAYWRWYVNAPPSGANPASDWWQVEVSNDGGDSWEFLENTLQQDVSWRRNAFRVADIIELTDEFQMRFIASDSTTIGEYLDGGSLIEAAVDDIILYDVASGESIAESGVSSVIGYPNPTSDRVVMEGWMPGATLRCYQVASGKLVREQRANGALTEFTVKGWSPGLYEIVGADSNGRKACWTLNVTE